jgi:signal transduction histidine kinase
MGANTLSANAFPLLASLRQSWQTLEPARRLTGGMALILMCVMVYAGSVLASYIEQVFAQKAAASTALYMDSFVEPLVQELTTEPSLSAKNQDALQRLLSPTSAGKPIVAFRIWVGDRIVFSSRREIIGKQFAATLSREHAYQGDVVAKFGVDGDDDAEERALHAPILEIYAPIRRTGTSQIIALAETSELAIELEREIRAAQYTGYAAVASTALGVLWLLFWVTDALRDRIGELARQTAKDAQFTKRVCSANTRVFELNERNLQRLSKDLQAGPLQQVSYALLRLDAIREARDRPDEVEDITNALKKSVNQIRSVAARLAPSRVNNLSPTEVIETAASLHQLRSSANVTCELGELPEDAPSALKTCLYQFILEGLKNLSEFGDAGRLRLAAAPEPGMLVVDLVSNDVRAMSGATRDLEKSSEDLRYQIEALGGMLCVRYGANGDLIMTASFRLGDMEIANG